MRRMDCKDCGCPKAIHKIKLCMGCYEIYHDNYTEWRLSHSPSPWHKFKLDNLKYLEQIYESKSS